MRSWLVSMVVALLAIAGCEGASNHVVFVDLRTDYLAGAEVSTVEVDLFDANDEAIRHREVELVAGTDLLAGVRVAELFNVPDGVYLVRARLRSPDTALRAERRVAVRVSGDLIAAVAITRSCAAIECPGSGDATSATECVDRRCVAPDCELQSDSACVTCTGDSECDSLSSGCVRGRCLDGICFAAPSDLLCIAPQRCDLTLGCVGGPDDAGPDDGGVDAGSDAGADAGPPPGPDPPDCPSQARDCTVGEQQDWSRAAPWACRVPDNQLSRIDGTLTCRVCDSGACRDCEYSVVVECRCAGNTCSNGLCDNIEPAGSRCDVSGEEFACPNITARHCQPG